MACGAILGTLSTGVVKAKGVGAQKRVSGKQKTRRRFPHERLSPQGEGRNSPLMAYEAIKGMLSTGVVKTKGMVPRRGLEPPRPYGH
jgi:hypothetical protein